MAAIRARRSDADLAGELITAPGDRPDEIAVRAESGAQCRNLNLQIVLLDDAIRPYALHHSALADDRSLRIDQCHEHVKSAPADLDWSSVGKELAAVRPNLETHQAHTHQCTAAV